jgi:hypothetical protein
MWLAWLGCVCREPDAPSAAAVAAASADRSRPAPSRTVAGLTLGTSTAADVEAWTAGAGSCTTAPSPRRTTTRTECDAPPVSLMPDRTIRGAFDQIVVARPDDGPVHFVSARRLYSLPADARADYEAARAALTASLGTPQLDQTSADPLPETRLVRYASGWEFSDLGVRLTLLKAAGKDIAVTEVWSIPGVEERAGVRGHAASASSGASQRPGWEVTTPR